MSQVIMSSLIYPEYLLAFVKGVCKIDPGKLTQKQINEASRRFRSRILKYFSSGKDDPSNDITSFIVDSSNASNMELRDIRNNDVYVQYIAGNYCRECSRGIILKLDGSIFILVDCKLDHRGNIIRCDKDDLDFCQKAGFSFLVNPEESVYRFRQYYSLFKTIP